MPKHDVTSLVINNENIRFGQCIANLARIKKGGEGETRYTGNITVYFDSAEDEAVVTPHIGKQIDLKFTTDAESYECTADAHDSVSFDGRPAFYILL